MSIDKEECQREVAKNEQEEARNFWSAETTVLEDDTVTERNWFDTAEEANRLAWVAIWVSVVAVVISVVSAISLSL